MKKAMIGMLILSMVLGGISVSFAEEAAGAGEGAAGAAAGEASAGAATAGVSTAAIAAVAAAAVAAVAIAAGSSGDSTAAPAAHGH